MRLQRASLACRDVQLKISYAVGTAGGLLLTPLFRPAEQKPSPDKSVLWMLAGISLSLIGVILAAWVTR